jgi:hypothetical protein
MHSEGQSVQTVQTVQTAQEVQEVQEVQDPDDIQGEVDSILIAFFGDRQIPSETDKAISEGCTLIPDIPSRVA